MPTRKDCALLAIEKGLAIFPLHYPRPSGECSCSKPGCIENKGKHPMTLNGFKDAKRNADFWDKIPNANIGVATGQISNVIVIDCDGEEGLENYEKFLEEGDQIHKTFSIKTGNGYHLYYRTNENEYPSTQRFIPNVDSRGEGGYVIWHGSRHKSGNLYRILNDAPFAELPQKAVEALLNRSKEKKENKSDLDVSEPMIESNPSREQQITQHCGKLFRAGFTASEVLDHLRIINHKKCVPPLPDEKLKYTVRNIGRRHAQQKLDWEKKQEQQKRSQETTVDEFFISTERFVRKYQGRSMEWIVKDWIKEASITMIYSQPGTFKTYMVLDFAVSFASGKKFLGEFETRKTGKIGIIQQEDDFTMLVDRLAQTQSLNMPQVDQKDDFIIDVPPNLSNIFWHDKRIVHFKDRQSVALLEQAIIKEELKVVILDPLYTMVSMKDYMQEAGQDMLVLKQLRDKYGVAFIIVHHMNKPKVLEGNAGFGGGREDIYGSQFINAFIEGGWGVRRIKDNLIQVKRHFKNAPNPKLIEFQTDFTDDFSQFKIINIREIDENEKTTEGSAIELSVSAKKRELYNEDQYDMMIKLALKNPEWRPTMFCKALSIDEPTFDLMLQRAMEEKKLLRRGNRWMAVEDTLSYLSAKSKEN